MATGLLGGDDVGAIVLDFGSYSLRLGYAGEDCPRWDVPSVVGVVERNDQKCYSMDANCHYMTNPDMEITNYMHNGLIDNFDLFEQKLSYLYNKCLMSNSSHHPILISEPVWNTKPKRDHMCELLFESFNVPAFYSSKNAVLSAFSTGKHTALVIDSGQVHTTCTPVYDGYVLNNAVVKSPFAGDYVTVQSKVLLEQMGIDLTPQYLIKSSIQTSLEEKPQYEMKATHVRESLHKHLLRRMLRDFTFHTGQVSHHRFNINDFEPNPITYTFPTGYTKDFTSEKFKISECLFNQNMQSAEFGGNSLTLTNAILTSLNLCDIDIRSNFCNNVLVVGGNSLLKGFSERLSNELVINKNSKIKMLTTGGGTLVEKRFSSWIGGSILASLGSFQQMWISKEEYEEHGRRIVDKKCS